MTAPTPRTDGPLAGLPIHVVHVREGYEDRAALLEQQMSERDLGFRYMLHGDVCDLTPDLLDTWFTGDEMHVVSPQTSCATKHLLIYERILESGEDEALILEDDAVLAPDFVAVVAAALAECRQRITDPTIPTYISFEDTTLKYVSDTETGRYLYPASKGRCAGAYWINRALATLWLETARRDKLAVPIDWYHNQFLERDDVTAFWCHPAVVEQGSHNGYFDSALQHRGKGPMARARWLAKKLIKKYVRRFFGSR